ncbi:unnamed protein product, partial [Pelagomonas calceolata]
GAVVCEKLLVRRVRHRRGALDSRRVTIRGLGRYEIRHIDRVGGVYLADEKFLAASK